MSKHVNKTGYCIGVFDYFHEGHFRLIHRACSLVQKLVIGVHTDEFTKSYKCSPSEGELKRLENVKKHFPHLEVFLIGGEHRLVYEKYAVTHIIHGDDWDPDQYIDQIGRKDFEDYKLNLVFIPHTNGINSSLIRAHKHYLDSIKVCILDMDGTIYADNKLTPCAAEFIDLLNSLHITHYFYTNNTSKIKKEYFEKLKNLGINCHNETQIVSPIDEVIDYLSQKKIWDIHLCATPGVTEYFKNKRFNTNSTLPKYVVLTYDTTLNFEKLKTISILLNRGIPLIATHIDKACPSLHGPIPDVGSFLAMIQAALGVTPVKTFGKPNSTIINLVKKRHNISSNQILVIGDRLYTDIAMAMKSGCLSALVLTGETDIQKLHNSTYHPDFILDDLSIILEQYKYE